MNDPVENNPIRTAVVGAGYLGKFHADKYASLPNSQLIAIADPAGQEIAQKHQVKWVKDYRDLIGQVDAVSIAAPTTLHHQIAKDFLQAGVHVLVEKPITVTLEEADELINIAKSQSVILQVGHLERFNAAILGLAPRLKTPKFIEVHRLAPYKPRATDVNVVLDLMIHDIDIILNMVGSDVVSIDACGTQVISESTDICNARLNFANGCVANVTASRISLKTERKMRIFQENACVTVDFQDRVLSHYQKGEGEMSPGVPNIESEQIRYEDGDALRAEIESFLDSVARDIPPKVTGEDGRRALEVAIQISKMVK